VIQGRKPDPSHVGSGTRTALPNRQDWARAVCLCAADARGPPANCQPSAVAQVAVLMSAPNRAADAGNRPPNAGRGSRRAFVLLSSSGGSMAPCDLLLLLPAPDPELEIPESRPFPPRFGRGNIQDFPASDPDLAGIRDSESGKYSGFVLPRSRSRFGRDFGTFPIPIISDLVGIGPIIGGLGISKSRFCQHRL
jgi:hypothetical protein